ncbi:MAG: alanine racemase, partial [Actinobacteria bacterium]|nr:alanine racemase [Actinomycetota bacterium]
AQAVQSAGVDTPFGVHLKVDTGMHRAGCDRDDAVRVAKAVAANSVLTLEGLMTHFAVADEPDHPATPGQMAVFEAVRSELHDAGFDPPIVHAANSAATILRPEAHFDLVRCGIALYGIPPAPALAEVIDLVPVMTLRTAVAQVRRVGAGERMSYGLRYGVEQPSNIAVLPIGYADGVPRRLGAVGGEVLIGGRRVSIAGTVTMDQTLVDCGDQPVHVGDEVVLIGRQGGEQITATEWAELLDTVGYEITCGIGARVPRRYIGA